MPELDRPYTYVISSKHGNVSASKHMDLSVFFLNSDHKISKLGGRNHLIKLFNIYEEILTSIGSATLEGQYGTLVASLFDPDGRTHIPTL